MPLENNTKKLYLAKSLKELNIKSNENVPTTFQNAERTYELAKKLYVEAKLGITSADEERAYVLFMRLANLIEKFKKTSAFTTLSEKKQSDIKKYFTDSISNAEKLKKSLIERYNLLNNPAPIPPKENEATKIVVAPKIEDLANLTLDSTMPIYVTAKQLYELLNDQNMSTLVIDTRPEKDFEDSQMKANSINIPEHLLIPGVTSKLIEEKLSPHSKELWNKRNTMDFVIMVDWNFKGNSLPIGSPLHCLMEAMCKWEMTKILKSDPLFLEDGYIGWVQYYPMFTTNSHIILPYSSTLPAFNNNIDLSSVDISYPNLDENPVTEPLPKSFPSTFVNNTLSTFPPIAPEFDRQIKKSDLAPNVLPNKRTPPLVNRALKPPEYSGSNASDVMPYIKENINDNLIIVQEQLEKEREFDRIRLLREKEAEEGMRIELQKQEEVIRDRVIELEKIAKAKSEEHSLALKVIEDMKVDLQKSNAKIIELEELQRIQLLRGEMSRMQDQVVKMREERKLREKEKLKPIPIVPPKIKDTNLNGPISKSLSTGHKSNLNRSFSSPNIAQMCAEEDIHDNNVIPQVDRTLKPASRMHEGGTFNFNNKSFTDDSLFAAKLQKLQPIYGSAGKCFTGIKNLGNTCFMGSVIQCLSATSPLSLYFYTNYYQSDINRTSKLGTKGEVLDEFATVIKALWTGQFKSITPREFKMTVSRYISICVGSEQQDAHEFMVMLMDKLHWDLNKAPKTNKSLENLDKLPESKASEMFWSHHQNLNKSIIVTLFEGLLKSTLTCLVCSTSSHSYEVFSCISLPLRSKQSRCTLTECLQFFVSPERMSGESAWNCPHCKQKQEAEKKMVILRLPPILIFHLKRFSYEGVWRQKLQTSVDFPLIDLDMSNYISSNQSASKPYKLYGIVNHFGSLEGGHYIALCKNQRTEHWVKYDDSEVTDLSLHEVRNPSAAYILFYNNMDI